MSYGHAGELAGHGGRPEVTPRIDPALLVAPKMLAALAARDITSVYRQLREGGVTQRTIAQLTGQSQSEVCEIIQGREVGRYDVLVRICDGLGVPREVMGLSYGGRGAYAEGATVDDPEGVDVEMLRRDVIGVGALAVFGFVPSFGTLLKPPAAAGEMALPSQLGMGDVAEIANTTEQLRTAARLQGGQARAVSAAAVHYGRLTQVPASESVAARLGSELAELHNLAGWCCFDCGLDRHARWHYRTAVDLAHRVGDGYQVASALRYTGLVDRWRGHPNDALKLYQLAQLKLGPRGDAKLVAWLHALSAHALADMGHEQAAAEIAKARDSWQPSNAYEHADWDYQTALVHMALGRLESAERFVATVNGAGRQRPVGTFAGILRATIHVQAGEPRGLGMAKTAIDAVAPLHSVRARERLAPLVTALDARPGNDARELARMARQVAATRA